MSEHARLLAKYLEQVEGGREVLEARTRELYPDSETDLRTLGDNDLLMFARGTIVIRRGASELSASFWELPRPEDPEASVRRAVEEDRR